MNTNFLFHGNLMKYETVSNNHKEMEKEILNNIQKKRENYLNMSQGYKDASSSKKKFALKVHSDV